MSVKIDHASLAVSDIDAAIKFFVDGLGCQVDFLEYGMSDQIASMLGDAGSTCDLAQLKVDSSGVKIELIAFRPATANDHPARRPVAPGMGHAALRVQDFDAVVERLMKLGAQSLGSITQFSSGRSVYLLTPVGAFLEIEEDLS